MQDVWLRAQQLAYGERGVELVHLAEADERLREVALSQALLAVLPDGVITYAADGYCLSANQAAANLLGVPLERLLAQNFRAISSWQISGLLARAEETLETGSAQHWETLFTSTAGKTLWLHFRLHLISLGVEPSLLLVLTDISERRQAEEVLRTSEERFRGLFEQGSFGVALLDQARRLLDVNPAFCRMLGYEKAELLGKSLADITAPEDVERSTTSTNALYEGELASLSMDKRYLRKNGEPVWGHLQANLIHDQDGKPAGSVAMIRDISAHKRAEEELRRGEAKFRAIVAQFAEGFLLVDEHGVISEWNQAMEDITGFAATEVLGLPCWDVMSQATLPERRSGLRERAKTEVLEALATGHCSQFGQALEGIILRPDGERRLIQEIAFPVRSEAAFCIGRVIQDITERRRAEEALKASQAQLKNAMDLADLVNWELDVDTGTFTFNDRFYALYGTSAEREGGYQMPVEVYAETFVHPDERDVVAQEVSTDSNYRSYLEHRIVRRDGEVRHIVVRYVRTKDDDGRTVDYGANQDITERKNAERDLAEALAGERQAQISTIEVLSSITDLHDPYTAGHQRGVARIALEIAHKLGLEEDRARGLEVAALLHDIGKANVPIEILSFPGDLTPTRRKLVQKHAQAGYDLLKAITFPWPVADMVLQHHEREDGSGYPQGLTGERLLLESKILAVADTVEAMGSHRPHRRAFARTEIRNELLRLRGTAYDPEIVDAYLSLDGQADSAGGCPAET